jgi:hypothetical protein
MKNHEIKIGPAMALEMLKQNKINRAIKDNVIFEYARQMKAGLWKEGTGETIKISVNNNILDGQHRLLALVKANMTLLFLVVYGLEEDVFSVLDTGVKRSPGDVLHIAGVKMSVITAAGIRKYYALTTGTHLSVSRGLSNAEMLTMYESRSKFWDAASTMAYEWYGKSQRLFPTSEWSGFFAYFHDYSNADAFNFMDALASGLKLDSKDPIGLLRQKLYFVAINKKFTMTPTHRSALIIKTWNYYRRRKLISHLKFNPETEEFPRPI